MSRYSVTVTGDTAAELADNLAAFVNMLHASTAYSATAPTTIEGTAERVSGNANAVSGNEKRKRGRPPKAKAVEPQHNDDGDPPLQLNDDPDETTVESGAAGEAPVEDSGSTGAEPDAPENADALRAELRDMLTKLHSAKGLNYVVRVLQQYNADRVSSVKPELLGRAIAEAKQYLGEQQ